MLGDKLGRSDVINIFPTKIGSYVFPNEYEKRLKQTCFNIINSFDIGSRRKSSSSTTTHYFDPKDGNESILDYPGFEAFHGWIKGCSIDYINNTLGLKCDNVIVTSCWMNECPKGGFQIPHNHANSFISGTYYVNFVKGMHAPINFMNPERVGIYASVPYFNLDLDSKVERDCNWDKSSKTQGYDVEPNEGQLLLWKSHIGHNYCFNNADKRVSISFNVMPETIPGLYNFKIEKVTS